MTTKALNEPALKKSTASHRPVMSDQGLDPTHPVAARDEYGDQRDLRIAGEFPLTIKVDHREVVTLMTLGTYPEKLTLGYLRNQRLVDNIEEIAEIRVDWERETVDVLTSHGEGIINLQEKIASRIVTSGCGQGTIFSCTLDNFMTPGYLGSRFANPRSTLCSNLSTATTRSIVPPVQYTAVPCVTALRSCILSRTWAATMPPTRSPVRCGWKISKAMTSSSTPPAA